MTKATKQSLFDQAYRGLAAQGWKKSLDVDGGCVYRGLEGRRCAVGHCISDEEYTIQMEEIGGIAAVTRRGYLKRLVPFSLFLEALQVAHDRAYEGDEMRELFEKLANIHGLSVPNLKEEGE